MLETCFEDLFSVAKAESRIVDVVIVSLDMRMAVSSNNETDNDRNSDL